MTQHQIELVKSSFAKILPIAQEVTDIFYSRLFEIAPYLRSLFIGDMKEQGKKMIETLTFAVDNLNRLEEIVPALQKMGNDHKSYGVANAHYDIVASALLWTLERGLGAEFTNDVRNAWVALYITVVDTLKKESNGDQKAA